MASYQVAPPSAFNFSNPEEWLKWIRRFQRFCQASGLSEKSSKNQVNMLVYTMGDAADNILSSFGLTDNDKKKYETVVAKFESPSIKKQNVIFERAKFNQRKQEEGESADASITDLYCLSGHCKYGGLREEMIRDRIVVGLRDSTLAEKLQLVVDLTLEKAVTAARQVESVKKQQKVVRAAEGSHSTQLKIDTIGTTKSSGKKFKSVGTKAVVKQPVKPVPPTVSEICTRCGKHQHLGKQQCPAHDVTC